MAKLGCLATVNSFTLILFILLRASGIFVQKVNTVKRIESGGRKWVPLSQQPDVAVVNPRRRL